MHVYALAIWSHNQPLLTYIAAYSVPAIGMWMGCGGDATFGGWVWLHISLCG